MSTIERPVPVGAAATAGPAGSAGLEVPREAGRLEGLDGLRALAIAAVVLFHLDPTWLPGGFLGVDVFFVVSGFLITTLLQREALRTGRVALRAFWVRRARRLVPALVACVVLTTVAARVADADLVVDVGRQVLGALTFSTNWVEIVAGTSYFDQTSPQLFMNFWSLAVEEQFYLLWPAVVALLVTGTFWRRLGGRFRAGVALAAALASTIAMALRYTPGEDATRAYYGTDTHLVGLMLGAALAFAWASSARGRYAAAWLRVRRPVLVVAGGTLAVLLWVVREDGGLAFRGGIALASLASAALLAGVLPVGAGEPQATGSRWRAVLSAEPVQWVGRRSYGIYLWHWPVIVVVNQDIPSAPGTPQHVVTATWCVVVTVALADLSYRFVEAPVRAWGFRACGRMAWSSVRSGTSWRPRVAAVGAAALVAAALVVVATAPTRSQTQVLAEQGAALVDPAPGSAPVSSPGLAPGTDWSMPAGEQIDVFGDSLVATTRSALQYYFPGVRLDATSNRRWRDGLAAVQARGADIRRAVVLAFGTNGGVDEAALAGTLDTLGPDRMVVLVNLYNPRSSWIGAANATLARVAASRPNVAVADWNAAVSARPDLLQSDRTHPTVTGAHLFAKTVRAAMAQLSTTHTGKPVELKELRAF